MSQLLVDHNLLTKTNYQQGNRDCEENVNERTRRKTGNKPQNPQNDQYDRYRPQHVILLSDWSFPLPVIASACPPEVITQSIIRNRFV